MESLRVISGSARGRTLKAVPGMGTRPTTDKVKEAVFSMIGPYFDGGTVLDLFAGTGGLGIEALSRGMDKAVFIDIDKKSIETIRHNLAQTGFTDKAEVYRNEAHRAILALAKRNVQIDLVFLDPPYRLLIIDELLLQMQQSGLCKANTVAVIEFDASASYGDIIGDFHAERSAEYGDTAIKVYRFHNVIADGEEQESGEK